MSRGGAVAANLLADHDQSQHACTCVAISLFVRQKADDRAAELVGRTSIERASLDAIYESWRTLAKWIIEEHDHSCLKAPKVTT